MSRIPFLLFFSALVAPASAHTGHQEGAGFLAGLTHPFLGADHVLAMIAAGLWAGIAGGRAAALWPAAFLAAMATGFAAARAGMPLSMIETAIAFSVVALGAAAAFGVRLSVMSGAAVCGLFATFHGVAHGIEMPPTAAGTAYSAGFLLATAFLLGSGLAVARLGRIARFAAAVTATGFMVLTG
jgi:urease accessory protein